MIIKERSIKDYRETVETIFDFAKRYADDLQPFAGEDIFAFYDRVKKLPYNPDGDIERVARPAYTIDENWKGPRDCDDKTLLILAHARLARIPARAIVVGEGQFPGDRSGNLHHIYPELYLPGRGWTAFDATYPDRGELGARLYREDRRAVHYP